MNPKGLEYIKGAFKMGNDVTVLKRQLEKQNTLQREVTEAYQKILNEDYRGNIYLSEGTKLARRLASPDRKDRALSAKLRADLADLIKDFQAKSEPARDSQDSQRQAQIRDNFVVRLAEQTLLQRKVDGFCSQLEKEERTAETAFADTRDRVYRK